MRGVGLGLAVVQRIATALGGTIDVESQPARGSCFMLRLPATEHSAIPYAQADFETVAVNSGEG